MSADIERIPFQKTPSGPTTHFPWAGNLPAGRLESLPISGRSVRTHKYLRILTNDGSVSLPIPDNFLGLAIQEIFCAQFNAFNKR
jgi:hypothetical protein